MTVQEILAKVDEIKPNTFDENLKITWLSELEGRIFNDVILTHVHDLVDDEEGNMIEPTFAGFDETSENEELLVPNTYCDLYRNYVFAQMDFANGETDRYNNSMIMFNNSYNDFCNWYNRTHKPIQKPLKLF